MVEEKERIWMKLENKQVISKDEEYFKKWYMTHSLKWMTGFNEAVKILYEIVLEAKK